MKRKLRPATLWLKSDSYGSWNRFHTVWSIGSMALTQRADQLHGSHWWKKALWSRFVRAIGPGCRTGINYSGPMPVPIPARTGTDRSPRGGAAARGGLGHWSRFVARTGIIDLRVLFFFPFRV
jgi:hypothetical protein